MLAELYDWYERSKRILPWRETEDPYCIWVSEIILQQTRVAQGLDYYLRFVSRFPTVVDLARADEDQILLLWQGLGYYSRARNMHRAARMIVELFDGVFPALFDDIRSLPGVGIYTAGAIASFAYNLPYPALDGNVYRVLARLADSDVVFDTSAGKKYFHAMAERLLDRSNPRLFNSALMELGALCCTPQSPDCEQCPVRDYCKAFANSTVSLLPLRKPRTTLRDRYLNYYIYLQSPVAPSAIHSFPFKGKVGKGSASHSAFCILHSALTIIHQRRGNDIWKHLWEFPLVESDCLFDEEPHFDFTHVLSHQRLHVRFIVRCVDSLPDIPETRIVSLSELDDFAFSRLTLNAIRKILM